MSATDPASLAAIKDLAQQAANIALVENADRFAKIDRHLSRLESKLFASDDATAQVPAPMKWAAGMVAALMTAGLAALVFWLVSSVNEMQQTLVRIDERQKASADSLNGRLNDFDRRIGRLEKTQHLDGGSS